MNQCVLCQSARMHHGFLAYLCANCKCNRVVFLAESDNEFSTPTKSPHHKTSQFHDHLRHAHHEHVEQQLRAKAEPSVRTVRGANVEVKTLEEIKLDRIQAESAAYYSYSGIIIACVSLFFNLWRILSVLS